MQVVCHECVLIPVTILQIDSIHKNIPDCFCLLGSQAAGAMENAGLYARLHSAFLHTAETLAEAVNRRDPYTGGYILTVSGIMLCN